MDDWLNLAGKVFIVTGGSSGIGSSIVAGLVAQGAEVVNADIQTTNSKTNNVTEVAVDISDEYAVRQLVSDTVEKFGKLDGIINNAGINIPALLVNAKNDLEKQIQIHDFDKMMAINVRGPLILAQEAAKYFVQQRSGVILNVSSECGLEGSEGQSCYAASKSAVNGLTRSWAKELGKYNVRVVGIAPGILEETALRTDAYEEALAYTRGITVDQLRQNYSKTSTIPLNRVGGLEEVSNLVAFLLSDRASYITGVTYNIAGGKTRG